MKTSKIEDQHTQLFALALWLDEPLEIIFFEKKHMLVQKMVDNMSKIVVSQKMSEINFPGLGTLI